MSHDSLEKVKIGYLKQMGNKVPLIMFDFVSSVLPGCYYRRIKENAVYTGFSCDYFDRIL